MRRLALAALLVFSGCIDPIETDSQPQARRPDPAPPPRAARSEEPSPPPPRAPKEEAPPPTSAPQDPAPQPGTLTAEKLSVEPVDLSQGEKQNHRVIVFAADLENAKAALTAHRTRKEDLIRLLPPPKSGGDAGLYMIWGHYPAPNITEARFKAEVDPKTRRVRVTLPPFSGHRPDSGIGMDWGVDRNRSWTFVGFRAKLSTLPAGDYAFEVVEEEPGQKAPRTLAEGTFTLVR